MNTQTYKLIPVETKEKTTLVLAKEDGILFSSMLKGYPNDTCINIIAISNDEIKDENCWYYNEIDKEIRYKCHTHKPYHKKILFSTTKIGELPIIPQSFHSEICRMYNAGEDLQITIETENYDISTLTSDTEKYTNLSIPYLKLTDDNEVIVFNNTLTQGEPIKGENEIITKSYKYAKSNGEKLYTPEEVDAIEENFRNFIRANHLTSKWEEWIKQNSKQ